MSASYGQDLEVIHRCGEKEMLLTEDRNDTKADDDDAHDANTSGVTINRDKVGTIFFDYKDSGPEPERTKHLQRIKNTRNNDRVRTLNGEILYCNGHSGIFSTTELVHMALACHKEDATSNIIFPLGKERSDIAAYRYTYDQEDFGDGMESSFWNSKGVRDIILGQKFDDNDRK